MVHTVRGAFRDLNSKGRGDETFRKVWRGGSWQWISGPLPRGSFLASDRRATTKGDVETGEVVAQFSRRLPERKCSLDGFYLVRDDVAKPLIDAAFEKPKIGVFRVTLSDGTTIDLPDPMAH